MIKNNQVGFTLLELLIASAIAVVVASIGGMIIYRVFTDNRNVSDRLVAGNQLDRGGYWVSRDTQMADKVTTQGLLEPAVLILEWTDWGINTDSVSYTVTYSVTDVSNNTGKITRRFQDSNGTDRITQIAEDIYYDVLDTDGSTQFIYSDGLLTFTITTKTGAVQYSRTYNIYPRPNYRG